MNTLALLVLLTQQIPNFKEQVVDPDVGVCYAVTIADINGTASRTSSSSPNCPIRWCGSRTPRGSVA